MKSGRAASRISEMRVCVFLKKSRWNVCNVWNWIASSLRIHWMNAAFYVEQNTRARWGKQQTNQRKSTNWSNWYYKIASSNKKIKRCTHSPVAVKMKKKTFIFITLLLRLKLAADSPIIDRPESRNKFPDYICISICSAMNRWVLRSTIIRSLWTFLFHLLSKEHIVFRVLGIWLWSKEKKSFKFIWNT